MSKQLLAKLKWKRKVYEHGKRNRPLERNTGMLSEHAGKQHARLRPTWNEICQEMSKTT